MQARKLLQSVAVLGVLLAAASVPAHAQYYGSQSQYQNPVQWLFYGGLNVPTGSQSSLLNTGWNFGFGAAFRQQGSPLALRLDVDYASNNVSSLGSYTASGATKLNINGGWVDGWSIAGSGEFHHAFSDQIDAYALAGIGGYYVSAQLTEVGTGYVCNPWWYYCYYGTGNVVVASKAGTHFGWQAGVGLDFKLASGASLFVEARYTWVDTSTNTLQYIPIVIGARF